MILMSGSMYLSQKITGWADAGFLNEGVHKKFYGIFGAHAPSSWGILKHPIGVVVTEEELGYSRTNYTSGGAI